MRIKNTQVEIFRGDIEAIQVDAVVVSVSSELIIQNNWAEKFNTQAGPRVAREGLKQAPVLLGESVVTTGGDLPSKNVIHTVSVDADGGTNQTLLRKAVASAIGMADRMQFQTLGIPVLGYAEADFDPVGAAKILIQEIFKICQHSATGLKTVIICVADDEPFDVFDQTIRGYLRHLQEDLGPGPYVTVDIIIEMGVDLSEGDEGVIIIERSNPPYGFALPGGFLDYGESLEDAARREAKEETNLDLCDLRQFHTYSVMGRDPRFQTVSTIFIARGIGVAQSGDDAKALKMVPYKQLMEQTYAFDHKEVLRDYLAVKFGRS